MNLVNAIGKVIQGGYAKTNGAVLYPLSAANEFEAYHLGATDYGDLVFAYNPTTRAPQSEWNDGKIKGNLSRLDNATEFGHRSLLGVTCGLAYLLQKSAGTPSRDRYTQNANGLYELALCDGKKLRLQIKNNQWRVLELPGQSESPQNVAFDLGEPITDRNPVRDWLLNSQLYSLPHHPSVQLARPLTLGALYAVLIRHQDGGFNFKSSVTIRQKSKEASSWQDVTIRDAAIFNGSDRTHQNIMAPGVIRYTTGAGDFFLDGAGRLIGIHPVQQGAAYCEPETLTYDAAKSIGIIG